jgi:hypothetical protein
MNSNSYKSETSDSRVDIDARSKMYAYGKLSSSNGKTFYKSVRIDGLLFEAQDLVRQKSYNNSTIRLKNGTFAIINKFFNDQVKGWRMFVTLIQNGTLTDMVSYPIQDIDALCVCIHVDDVYYPMPLLTPLRILLR